MRHLLSLLFFLVLLGQLNAQSDQTWYAVLNAGGQVIPLNVELTGTEGEQTAGSLQSPAQSESRIDLSTVHLTADSLVFEVAALSIQYVGRIVQDSIAGTFQQATFSTPLTFYRAPPEGYLGKVPEVKVRPQDPTDFPYRREAVNFPGGTEEVQLAGELTLPEDTLPKALVILVTGSGAQDRNEDLGPQIDHRPFLVLSDYLTRRGYGVLRYDERGIGESSGQFRGATSADFADDARGAIRYLRDRGELEGIPTGIIGHSEGGMIGEMIGAAGEIDFLVLLAAPGHPIDSLMSQQRRQLAGGGQTPADDDYHRAIYTYLKLHPDQEEYDLRGGLLDTVTAVAQSKVDPNSLPTPGDNSFLVDYSNTYAEPWLRYFITFDPAEYLNKITVPILAINGTLDQQVDVSNLESIGAGLDAAGNDDVTVVVAPGLNHLLQPATTGAPDEYGKIETTIDPSVLEEIGQWLDSRF